MKQIEFYQHKLDYETDSFDTYKALQEGAQLVVIDARSEEAYRESHIPGALNLPHRTMDETTTADLDRDALYVTYCDGIGCNASTRGALKMSQLGFKVKELLGGIDWWQRDGYPIEGEGNGDHCGC